MKMTLLEMVQNILGAMTSDDVNSIADTVEAQKVADTIKTTYMELISSRDWPFRKQRSSLTGLGDTANPTKMRFPTNVDKVYWIKYNKKDVDYLDPKQFQDMIDNRMAQTGIIDINGYGENSNPKFWTTFDDDYVIFDSIDTSLDTTLQESKSVAFVLNTPTWIAEDAAIPEMPDKMFSTLLADAKGTCFLNIKQTENKKEERIAQRGKVRMQNEAWRNEKGESMTDSNINYGRDTPATFRSRIR